MVALQSEDRVVLALPQALIIQEVWVIRPELLIAHGGKHAPQSCVCVCVFIFLWGNVRKPMNNGKTMN